MIVYSPGLCDRVHCLVSSVRTSWVVVLMLEYGWSDDYMMDIDLDVIWITCLMIDMT